MPATVKVEWNGRGLRSYFRSDAMYNALLEYSKQLAEEKEGELAEHLHSEVKNPLLAARVDRLKYTCVGTIHPTNRIGYNLAKKYLNQ